MCSKEFFPLLRFFRLVADYLSVVVARELIAESSIFFAGRISFM
jgi:hypothetical protein